MPAGSATQEPGAGDNRFTCNPNDPAFEPMKELEDGKQYRICMLATQSSAGELVVDSVESAEPPGEGDMEGEDMGEETGAMGRAKDKYPNPAVAKMVKGEE
jgi:hypothetical protein